MVINSYIEVSIGEQRLRLLEESRVAMEVKVSTAKNGPGERNGSECTPRGRHVVRAKVGAGCPENTVFRARRPTGEIYSPELRRRFPERDWILTRILWLSGTEPGRNRLGEVDTMRRYVYIHGCPDDDPMGIPSSHGCVKMRNRELVELFERVAVGTPVIIKE
ncbi:L,D-transpeptidase family protein [Thiohalomonas denitrificans]|uniref:L,D-transpeptidase family protein n=1 Tax=Thiohalomonas denitrificans TaxID=415747 RepID=UPI003982F52B